MKTLVVFQSKTGFTQRYAQWIAEDLGCDAKFWKDVKATDLAGYDVLIYGGPLMAGSITGLKAFAQAARKHTANLVVFATGATPAQAEDGHKTVENNLKDMPGVRGFYFPGGMCYEKLGAVARAMMKMFCAMVKKQEGEDSPAYKMLQSSYDLTDRGAIEPLVAYCAGLDTRR